MFRWPIHSLRGYLSHSLDRRPGGSDSGGGGGSTTPMAAMCGGKVLRGDELATEASPWQVKPSGSDGVFPFHILHQSDQVSMWGGASSPLAHISIILIQSSHMASTHSTIQAETLERKGKEYFRTRQQSEEEASAVASQSRTPVSNELGGEAHTDPKY